ncbi:Growth-regulating factor [Heracleum sosnowskyi]|uniref:Growth-regulating factor n=1 Tax=Heracleum sosnowskyi TaxID=360622 RepID=A0AAD8MLR5_9APIA|nr:Growth-regulating factor [Heracleum sosnowskyi]
MDPEPGRCRRTDGYKWRCRKDVLPNTKYCERHIHRGRSRKHVETSKIPIQLNTPTITYPSINTPTATCSRMTSQKITSHNPDDTSGKLPTHVHENQQNKIPSLGESKDLTCTATAITTSANGKSKTHSVCVENDKSSRESGDYLNGVVAGSNHIKDKSNKESSNSGGSETPEHSISAKSVVKGNPIVVSCNKVCEHHGLIAVEAQRCRRTDDRRWQCSNEAIPQQKYCESHMPRGPKRCRSSSEAETFTATPAAHSEAKSDRTNSHTDLLISPGKCPHPTNIDLDGSTSGSSSDSTTITDIDENISTSHILS